MYVVLKLRWKNLSQYKKQKYNNWREFVINERESDSVQIEESMIIFNKDG